MSESKTKLTDYIKSLNETLKKGEISLIAGAHGISKSKLFEGLIMSEKIISDIVTLDSVEMDAFRYSVDGSRLYARKDPKNKRKAEHKLKGVNAIMNNQLKSQLAKKASLPDMYKPKPIPPDMPRKIDDSVW